MLEDSYNKQTIELTTARSKITELNAKVGELEESLSAIQKDLLRSHELNAKLQRDIREVILLIVFDAI